MKHEIINMDGNVWTAKIPDTCAEVAIGCAEAAETLKETSVAANNMSAESDKLAVTIQQLSVDTSHVAAATKQARMLSIQAREMLESGEQTIQMSTKAFADIIGLIEELGQHVNGFAGAMEQVRNASLAIDGIARTTNMLALNASIEAAKAGDAGRSFAVVAEEVKKLAFSSRSAAVEITQTINSLALEAEKFVTQIETGKDDSDKASHTFDSLKQLLEQVGGAVAEIGEVNVGIADNTSALNDSLVSAGQIHKNFDKSVEQAHSGFDTAMRKILGLEIKTNQMFDHLVHSGISKLDQRFVELALQHAADIMTYTDAAIDSGEISTDDIFDLKLIPISGSNPPRFKSRMTPWADKNWRPILDKIFSSDSSILTSSISDMQGFLPTHMSHFSLDPNGNLAHDTAFCRNGRVLFEGIDIEAKKSDANYMMGVYCQEGDGKSKNTIRNIYVPLRFKGRRWGDLEIGYTT
jgi:methyl-accepting chemotaxis protein